MGKGGSHCGGTAGTLGLGRVGHRAGYDCESLNWNSSGVDSETT
jgi:hypothetical protein